MGIKLQSLVMAFCGLAFGTAQATCYTVYKGQDRIYYSQAAPVDTRLSYSDTVPARFGPGATMVVTSGYDCPLEDASGGGETSNMGSVSADGDAVKRDALLRGLAARNGGVIAGDDGEWVNEATYSSGGYGASRGPVYTGKRGGQYYYNSSGNKQYIPRGASAGKGGGRGR